MLPCTGTLVHQPAPVCCITVAEHEPVEVDRLAFYSDHATLAAPCARVTRAARQCTLKMCCKVTRLRWPVEKVTAALGFSVAAFCNFVASSELFQTHTGPLCHSQPQLTAYAISFLKFVIADLPESALSVDLLLRACYSFYKQ